MKPFLKWAGGKQKVLSSLVELLPSNVRDCRYVEPFVGGGAMFFRLEPETAVLGDVNERLVCCYRQVRDNVEGVLELLEPMAAENSAERYAMRRNWFNASTPGYSASAALFIYLNKTCFNGLYRENKNGKFNVPYGKYEKPLICDADHLRKASSLLKRAELLCGSFTQTAWVKGDFVYLDPPYDPVFEESQSSCCPTPTPNMFASSTKTSTSEPSPRPEASLATASSVSAWANLLSQTTKRAL
jgi:DNA adenine methylase